MSRKGRLLGFDCYVVQSALAGSDHKAAHIASTSRSWKKLSAFHYSRSEMIVSFDRWTSLSRDQLPINTILYTTAVINTPSRNESDIGMARDRLMGIAMNPIRVKAKEVLDAIRLRDEASRREILNRPGSSPCDRPPVDPTYFKTFELYEARKKAIPDPTTLIIIDERTGRR
jgi:hypothetical protein